MLNMQELGEEIIRTGYIVYDSISAEEDLNDDEFLHHIRLLEVIVGDEAYYVRKRDGQVVEIKLEYDHPTMMANSSRYRKSIEEKIRERYGV